MNTFLKTLAVTALALSATKALAAGPMLTVAVFDFDSSDEEVRGLGPKVATLVNANLSAEPQIITVDRSDLKKILGEQELGLSGMVTPESAAKVGQLTGAKVLVTGRVFEAGGQMILVAKTIGTETSRVYGEMVSGPADAPITDLSAQLEKKIAADVIAKGGTLVASVESLQDRVTRIRKAMGSQKLPVVSVDIPEQYFGQYVIDPAAQTELSLILKQCGFTVVDSASTNRAQVAITGQAFGEYGMQKGNLVSCRARIEIKARDVASGNILDEDRQTSMAVDLAEHVAAKTALQNGADELAERLIPALVSQSH
jgi:Curli production assembly/transport component CsgG